MQAQQLWGATKLVSPEGRVGGPVFELMPLLHKHSRPDVVQDVVEEMIRQQQLPADPDNPQAWEAAFQHFGTQGARVHQAKNLITGPIKDELIRVKKVSAGRINLPAVGWYDWCRVIMAMDQVLAEGEDQHVLLADRDQQICYYHWGASGHLEGGDTIFGLSGAVYERLLDGNDRAVVWQMVHLVYKLLHGYQHLLPHYRAEETEGVPSRLLLHPNSEGPQTDLSKLWIKKGD